LLLRKSHPVNYVASPTKFGEYLAAGVPVIATEGIGDTSDLIKNENIGIIISPTDEGLNSGDSNLLIQFTDDVKKNRSVWSDRCVTAVKKFLEWKNHGRMLANAYIECFEAKQPGNTR